MGLETTGQPPPGHPAPAAEHALILNNTTLPFSSNWRAATFVLLNTRI